MLDTMLSSSLQLLNLILLLVVTVLVVWYGLKGSRDENVENGWDIFMSEVEITVESVINRLENQRRELEGLIECAHKLVVQLRRTEEEQLHGVFQMADKLEAESSDAQAYSHREHVLTLAEQDHDERRIAAETGLAIGEVELILKMYSTQKS